MKPRQPAACGKVLIPADEKQYLRRNPEIFLGGKYEKNAFYVRIRDRGTSR